jgi:hypothetical protein
MIKLIVRNIILTVRRGKPAEEIGGAAGDLEESSTTLNGGSERVWTNLTQSITTCLFLCWISLIIDMKQAEHLTRHVIAPEMEEDFE